MVAIIGNMENENNSLILNKIFSIVYKLYRQKIFAYLKYKKNINTEDWEDYFQNSIILLYNNLQKSNLSILKQLLIYLEEANKNIHKKHVTNPSVISLEEWNSKKVYDYLLQQSVRLLNKDLKKPKSNNDEFENSLPIFENHYNSINPYYSDQDDILSTFLRENTNIQAEETISHLLQQTSRDDFMSICKKAIKLGFDFNEVYYDYDYDYKHRNIFTSKSKKNAINKIIEILFSIPNQRHYKSANDNLLNQITKASLFAPSKIIKEKYYLIILALHKPEDEKSIEIIDIPKIDKEQRIVASKNLNEYLKVNDFLTISLQIENIEIRENTQKIRWLGDKQFVEFVFKIPESYSYTNAIARVMIIRDFTPIGSFGFNLSISTDDQNILRPVSFTKYSTAFVSYSSKDINEVSKRIQGIEATKTVVFQDLKNLRAGDNWEDVIKKKIIESDVFFLFWSSNAKNSVEVRKEWQLALDSQKRNTTNSPDIVPIILEGPPPPSPPEELKHLHFNDPNLYYIGKGITF